MTRDEALALAAAAGCGIQVGAAMVATRLVIDQSAPASLALMRYLIGAALLLPFALRRGIPPIARKDRLPIAVLGIAQFGILIGLLNVGLEHATSARAALVFAVLPLLALVIATVLGRERASAAKVLGVALTVAGVATTLGENALTGGGHPPDGFGLFMVFCAALVGAICSVYYGPYLRRYPALPVGTLAMLASVAFLAPLAVAEGSLASVASLTLQGWGAVVFIGAGSAAGYLLWLYALARVSPTRVTVFLSLSPLTAALLGALLLHEPLTPGLLAGIALVAAGLAVAQHTPGPAAGPC